MVGVSLWEWVGDALSQLELVGFESTNPGCDRGMSELIGSSPEAMEHCGPEEISLFCRW